MKHLSELDGTFGVFFRDGGQSDLTPEDQERLKSNCPPKILIIA